MKYWLKTFIIFLLSLLVVFGFSTKVFATSEAHITRMQYLDERLMELFQIDNYGEIEYPDFFGGVHYTPEGSMVLQIVQDCASRNSTQYNLVRDFIAEEDIIVEYVNFSYNEINATMDFLGAMIISEGRPEAFDNVQTIAVDTKNNTVTVWLTNYSEEEIILFRETILNSQLIAFEESVGDSTFLGNDSSSSENTFFSRSIILGGGVLLGLGILIVLCILWKRMRRHT